MQAAYRVNCQAYKLYGQDFWGIQYISIVDVGRNIPATITSVTALCMAMGLPATSLTLLKDARCRVAWARAWPQPAPTPAIASTPTATA